MEECNIIKIKIHQDPASATSETYKLKVPTFENGKPEELVQIMKGFNTATDGKRTTSATEKKFLSAMLRREALREADVFASQVGCKPMGVSN